MKTVYVRVCVGVSAYVCVCVRGACVCLSCNAEQNKAPYLSSQQWEKRPDTRRNLFFSFFTNCVVNCVVTNYTQCHERSQPRRLSEGQHEVSDSGNI